MSKFRGSASASRRGRPWPEASGAVSCRTTRYSTGELMSVQELVDRTIRRTSYSTRNNQLSSNVCCRSLTIAIAHLYSRVCTHPAGLIRKYGEWISREPQDRLAMRSMSSQRFPDLYNASVRFEHLPSVLPRAFRCHRFHQGRPSNRRCRCSTRSRTA